MNAVDSHLKNAEKNYGESFKSNNRENHQKSIGGIIVVWLVLE